MNIFLPKIKFKNDDNFYHRLQNRRTIRKFSNADISSQELSNILWCAAGESKTATKQTKNRRTIPSACNSKLVTVYVALKSGCYKYNEVNHQLIKLNNHDIRSNLSNQKMLKHPTIGLIYVADNEKNSGIYKADLEKKSLMYGMEAGAISQNIYLYCADSNLNTTVVGLFNREVLSNLLELSTNQQILYTQVIG